MNFPSAEEQKFIFQGVSREEEEEEESLLMLSMSAMIEQFLWWKVVAGQKC
jgi:hypothetical protein